ncbi:hypothetical protein SAMN05421748_115138 [Paractinoplanes atraurantiacus]|uniref:Lipoprotein LprG n=1 Tax=Paractinoplanes atraurantiacus TaxID=1036182 RepID=A0A285J3D0_9ACTN|nr:hypothetical protein SAMN05421748_115138 [Actinoplanes atraurantiacus]
MVAGVVVVLGLSACAGPEDGGRRPEVAVSVSLPADPKAALEFGAGKLGTQSARVSFTLGSGGWPRETFGSGVVDATGTNYEITGESFVVRRIGDEVWLKLLKRPEGTPADQWFFHEKDLNKWMRRSVFNMDTSTTFSEGFPWKLPRRAVKNGSDFVRTGERAFKGATATDSEKITHFSAELDQAGRITRLGVGTAEPFDNLYEYTFSDFGTSVELQPPPAAEVIDVEYVDPLSTGFW